MSDGELVVIGNAKQEIEHRRKERLPLVFTDEQRDMIRNTYAPGSSESEFAVLMAICQAKRLNPILGQVHLVKRWTQDRGDVWATQTGIDGFRSIAEDTGLYDGQDEPEFTYDGEGDRRRLVAARVRVYRKDIVRPFVGVAHFAEYVQKKKDGSYTKMWAEKPHIMLAKTAEALAMRKAFPQDLGDLYTSDELGNDAGREERGAAASRQVGQVASGDAPKPLTVDWAKLLHDARAEPLETAGRALDAIAVKMKTDVPQGAARETLKKLYLGLKAEVRAEKEAAEAAKAKGGGEKVEAEPCGECGLVGTHAKTCPDADDAAVEPEPQS